MINREREREREKESMSVGTRGKERMCVVLCSREREKLRRRVL